MRRSSNLTEPVANSACTGSGLADFGGEIDAIVEAAQQHGFGGERGQHREIRRTSTNAADQPSGPRCTRMRDSLHRHDAGLGAAQRHRPRTPRPCAGARCDRGTVRRRRWVVRARRRLGRRGDRESSAAPARAPRHVRAGDGRAGRPDSCTAGSPACPAARAIRSPGSSTSTNSSLRQNTCQRCQACSNEMCAVGPEPQVGLVRVAEAADVLERGPEAARIRSQQAAEPQQGAQQGRLLFVLERTPEIRHLPRRLAAPAPDEVAAESRRNSPDTCVGCGRPTAASRCRMVRVRASSAIIR